MKYHQFTTVLWLWNYNNILEYHLGNYSWTIYIFIYDFFNDIVSQTIVLNGGMFGEKLIVKDIERTTCYLIWGNKQAFAWSYSVKPWNIPDRIANVPARILIWHLLTRDQKNCPFTQLPWLNGAVRICVYGRAPIWCSWFNIKFQWKKSLISVLNFSHLRFSFSMYIQAPQRYHKLNFKISFI